MSKQESDKDILGAWIDQQTRIVDLVGSWEVLCQTYHDLEFNGPEADELRIKEFKWIITEVNRFLGRMRTKLLNCKDSQAVRLTLQDSTTPKGKVLLDTRKQIAFQKYRQQWVMYMLAQLPQIESQILALTAQTEGESDGFTDDDWYTDSE